MKRLTPMVLALVSSLALSTGNAGATCGTGNTPSYDDVQAVLLTNDYRVSDGYRDKTAPAPTLRSSTYWLFFWEDFPTAYAQFTLKGSAGAYRLNATLADAKSLLERDRFYSLNPSRKCCITEQTLSVLTVLHCGVVTRIAMYNNPEFQERPTAKLFADFETLITDSRKTKLPGAPANFKPTLLFDP